MRRLFHGTAGRWVTGLVLALGLTLAAHGGEDASARKRVVALGQTTGDAALKAEVNALTAHPERAKKLIAAAVALAKSKDQPLAYNAAYILAQVAAELKDIKGSEVLYRLCTAQAARLQSTHKLLQSYGGLIDLLYENKKFDASAKVCRELLELKTGDGKPRIYYLAVPNRFGEPDFIEEEDFDAGKRLRPGVHRLMIQAIAKQGKFDQALKLVDNLIRAQDNWQERQLRGWVLREAGRYQDAARAYEDVLERIEKDNTLDQAEKDEYAERYRYILSNVYVDLNKIDKAAQNLQALIAKRPEEPSYYNDLGYIWADHDMNLPKSEELIRKALELDRARRLKANPKFKAGEDAENGAYLDSLGWVLFKQKKYKEAKQVMESAVKDKNSQHIEIYDHLAEVLMALGERDAAIAAWQRGVELAGTSSREKNRKAEVEKKLQKHAK